MENYADKLHNILFNNELSRYEICGYIQVAIAQCVLNKYHVYIYGAGRDVDIFIQWLEQDGLTVYGIIDKNENKVNTYIRNVKVISRNAFLECGDDRSFVFVYTAFQPESIDAKEIMGFLEKAHVIDYCIVGGNRAYIIKYHLAWNDMYAERRIYYQQNENAILLFMHKLCDDTSKEILMEYISTFMERRPYQLKQLPTIWKYFYGENGKRLYQHESYKSWVNFGANVGDTIWLFARNGLHADKIYAVEGDYKTAQELRHNMETLPKTTTDRVEVVEHFVAEDDYFECYFKNNLDRIGLINCDVEGAELLMLKQMRHVIVRDRPVLAICLYHKKEDIIDIPVYLDSIVKNYKLVLRKYVPWWGTAEEEQELVLYAIPYERSL